MTDVDGLAASVIQLDRKQEAGSVWQALWRTRTSCGSTS
jgi:hypothetical protein